MLSPFKEELGMPLQEICIMDLRQEFVVLASQEGANMRELCRRYGISPTTGYRYLARWQAEGAAGLADRSRRPHTSPAITDAATEAAVLAVRDKNPAWGGRKLHHALARQGVVQPLPAPSTITAILRRHDRLAEAVRPTRDYQRFEAPQANELWQLDFMGEPDLPTGKVHPLTLLDDHSRFALLVAACPHERADLVRAHLTTAFQRYGLPRRILSDNGPPWGAAGAGGITALEAWWLRLGIAVSHGRPIHPQTQGKLERLHRTMWAEVVGIRNLPDLATAQRRFDAWRARYNGERPHEALAYAVPVERYRTSPRSFPETEPPISYGPDDAVRRVYQPGRISFGGREFFVSHGLIGLPVAVRPTPEQGQFTVWYCQRQVATIDLAERR
jgi:transposase InsO family protein